MADRGRWSGRRQYRAGDIVTVSGTSWMALVDNSNVIPGTNFNIWGVQTGSGNGTNTERLAATNNIAPASTIGTPGGIGADTTPDNTGAGDFIIGGSANITAWYPQDLISGSRRTIHNMISFTMTGPDADDPAGEIKYRSATDQEIRQNFANHINGNDTNGVPRRTYLNTRTTGYILFDLEAPLNLGAASNYTDEQLTWFVQGIIRRIQIFRERVPNAKIGVWRFGDPDTREANDEAFQRKLEKQVFASNVTYNGQKFIDAIQFYQSGLYHYRGPGSEGYNRIILQLKRVDQVAAFIARMRREHGVTKPFIPFYENTYVGNHPSIPIDIRKSNRLNAIEIKALRDRNITNHHVLWYPSWQELYASHAQDRAQILEEMARPQYGF